jgi:hypothetical protein
LPVYPLSRLPVVGQRVNRQRANETCDLQLVTYSGFWQLVTGNSEL